MITPPVEASAISEPAARAVGGGLLADPGHQEDVVVDAEGDQEHEDEQREARIRVRTVEDVGRRPRAEMPRAAPKDRITVPIRISGEVSARSSPIRISITASSMIGMTTLLSRAEAVLDVDGDGGPAADLGVGPATAWTASRTSCTASIDWSSRASAVRLTRISEVPFSCGDDHRVRDAVDPLHRCDDLVGLVGVRDDLDRGARVDQPVLDQELVARDRLDVVAGDVGLVVGDARGVEAQARRARPPAARRW